VGCPKKGGGSYFVSESRWLHKKVSVEFFATHETEVEVEVTCVT
jgi:hypothetical protein